MLSKKDRLIKAQKDVDEIIRMQSPYASVLRSSGNVVIPTEEQRVNVELSPEKLILQSTGPQDDDVRLKIGGVDIFNPKQCIIWYKGELNVGPDFNTNFQNTGFRVCSVTRNEAIKAGAKWELGATVEVDTFDGWGGRFRTAPWIVTIILNGGSISKKTGGSTSVGLSPQQRPQPTGDYYRTGPHFESYRPNGSFTLN